MHILHETVEMDALLALDRDPVEKAVHEKALAPPHPAPEVDSSHGLVPLEQPEQGTPGLPRAGNFARQPVEGVQGAFLGRIEDDATRGGPG